MDYRYLIGFGIFLGFIALGGTQIYFARKRHQADLERIGAPHEAGHEHHDSGCCCH